MPWSEERKAAFSAATKERLAAIPPSERRRRTEAGREAGRQAAIRRRHERWAEELRRHGWTVHAPESRETQEDTETS